MDLTEILKIPAVCVFCMLYSQEIDMVSIVLLPIGLLYLATRRKVDQNISIITESAFTGILIIGIVFLMLLAQIQAGEAKKQTKAALMAQEEALKSSKSADQQRARAEAMAAEAIKIQKKYEIKSDSLTLLLSKRKY